MHWFWRAAIAVFVGCVYGGLVFHQLAGPHRQIGEWIVQAFGGVRAPFWRGNVAVAIAYFLPVLLLAFGTYGLVTRFLGPRPFGNQTRCRKCGYILRGISEPRCPKRGSTI